MLTISWNYCNATFRLVFIIEITNSFWMELLIKDHCENITVACPEKTVFDYFCWLWVFEEERLHQWLLGCSRYRSGNASNIGENQLQLFCRTFQSLGYITAVCLEKTVFDYFRWLWVFEEGRLRLRLLGCSRYRPGNASNIGENQLYFFCRTFRLRRAGWSPIYRLAPAAHHNFATKIWHIQGDLLPQPNEVGCDHQNHWYPYRGPWTYACKSTKILTNIGI